MYDLWSSCNESVLLSFYFLRLFKETRRKDTYRIMVSHNTMKLLAVYTRTRCFPSRGSHDRITHKTDHESSFARYNRRRRRREKVKNETNRIYTEPPTLVSLPNLSVILLAARDRALLRIFIRTELSESGVHLSM